MLPQAVIKAYQLMARGIPDTFGGVYALTDAIDSLCAEVDSLRAQLAETHKNIKSGKASIRAGCDCPACKPADWA